MDLMKTSHEKAPKANERILCRHPNQASKRVFVVPGRVEEMLKLYWSCGKVRFISLSTFLMTNLQFHF
ncbi:unnamed protein product [Trichobilharzia regenti]|nr:unnamed protein product [Trichobilharzia regenti]